ncbi:DUF636 domain protein [Westerdykella ornata]|uniref:DUF636 domain protein n=1 Tax=Westerdykella ornata TaxID=318751 RepID=A0A6A6J7E7_WESOR|nr:DUF636 domain protein [Westerdykella ornata]KAF2272500.1 DUF636 domain protein [Westerdykella ornata]
MVGASCLCGAVRIQFSDEVLAKVLCHCLDCRKISGSTYSTNILVPGTNFSIASGTPKQFTKKVDSGKDFTSFFCGDCGSTLWREGESFGDGKVIKVGTVDDVDALGKARPETELFARSRVEWVREVEGAVQKETS